MLVKPAANAPTLPDSTETEEEDALWHSQSQRRVSRQRRDHRITSVLIMNASDRLRLPPNKA